MLLLASRTGGPRGGTQYEWFGENKEEGYLSDFNPPCLSEMSGFFLVCMCYFLCGVARMFLSFFVCNRVELVFIHEEACRGVLVCLLAAIFIGTLSLSNQIEI